MSGIVGLVNWDGTPVDPRLLHRLTATLSARGPDRQQTWLDGPAGLGHAWLQTTDGEPDPQPLGLGGRLWIVADARLDDRVTLAAALDARGHGEVAPASDAALILRAYRAWGEDCLRHLLGDFVFAVWDADRRRLFCARDHFGVKPLYYAQTATGLVFSNTLDCVRLHPDVPGAVNDAAIGDFLLFGAHQDPATTAFEAIRRLPAAHHLAGTGRLEARRYWTLPIDGPIRYAHRQDYVDRFGELLGSAVADRLRCAGAGVLMSGGVDSTAVAATAKHGLSRPAPGIELRAYTTVCERLFADPERRYASLAAGALAVPVHYRVVDHYQLFDRWDDPDRRTPEPQADPLVAVHLDLLRDVAVHSRVALTGYGGDPVFRVPLAYATGLVRRGRMLELAGELGQYLLACRRLPRVRLGAHVRAWLGPRRPPVTAAPGWLTADLVTRLERRPRAAALDAEPPPVHPTRPAAYDLLTSSDWPSIFESYDAGTTGVPVAVRHPFFDVRLVRYLLAIPPIPWCFDKTILRLAMRGLLPESVRLRPKAVAAGDAVVALLRRPAAQWVDRFEPAPALGAYVRRDRVPRVHGEDDSTSAWTGLRPLCLNYWLASQAAGPLKGRSA
ncbi:MAG TPA: asparagine synthase-related protein [Methylomirabilota bacterium]|nr:asparagine synthase-related protein [Methylomirabilota bacterium]